MKTKLILIGLALVCFGLIFCVAALLYGQQRLRKYEFHTGADGQIMWQCNRQTGKVKIFTDYAASYVLVRGQYQDYLLNRQTGQTWRYFRNGTNSYPGEGFCPLPRGYPVATANPLNLIPDWATNAAQRNESNTGSWTPPEVLALTNPPSGNPEN